MTDKRMGQIMWLVVFVLCWVLVGSLDFEDAASDQNNYCYMVELHKQDPDNGWPDYNNNYNEACR